MKKTNWLHLAVVFLSAMGFLALTGCGGGGGGGDGEGEGVSSSPGTTTPAPAPTFSIGATTSGVLGQGLVLLNNGTDDLVITEDGFDRFSSRLEEGSSYNVTVSSQPSLQEQVCEVINGNGIVVTDDIRDVQIRCDTAFQESFDNEQLNPAFWSTTGEFSRPLVNGSLEYNLSSSSGFAGDYIRFLDETCGMISVATTITDAFGTGTGSKGYGTRLNSCGYHASAAGEAEGNKTGDVNAAIILRNAEAFFHVYKCLNDDCNNIETIENLTQGIEGFVKLGDVPVGSTANLLIDWNTIVPNQFTFQLNNGEAMSFDPVAAGANIDATTPNVIDKYLGIRVNHSDPNDSVNMTATFDDIIVNGSPYDDFDSDTYLNGSLWSKTYGQLKLDAGRLLLETGQEFVDNSGADNRYHDTSYTSIDGLIPNVAIAQADITLDSLTALVDQGGTPAEVSALLEMTFRPPALDKKDLTDTFVFQAILAEEPLGLLARVSATGCADSQCSTKYPLPDADQTFAAPINKGETYNFTIERMEDGNIGITLSAANGGDPETLILDMSAVSEFANTEFDRLRLKSRTRGTDLPSEEAFVRAYFDNFRLGSF